MKDKVNWQRTDDPYRWPLRNPITRWPYLLLVTLWVYRPQIDWDKVTIFICGALFGAAVAFHIADLEIRKTRVELQHIYSGILKDVEEVTK